MYALATAHLIINVHRAIEGFEDVPGGSLLFFGNLNDVSQTFKDVIYLLQTLVGDSLVVWRCCVVWGKHRCVLLLPIIMVIATAATGIGAIYTISKLEESQLFPWIASYLAVTLATNVICTGLIAFKLRGSRKELGGFYVQSSLIPILTKVMESGAIYSAALISVLVAYLTGRGGKYAAFDLIVPLIGIVLSLLIIRIQFITSSNNSSSSSSTQHPRCYNISTRNSDCSAMSSILPTYSP